jgi:hypothetical protein
MVAVTNESIAAVDDRRWPSGAYDPGGRLCRARLVQRRSAPLILGTDGLPQVRYDGGYETNPVTTAQYGLWAHRMYLNESDPEFREG